MDLKKILDEHLLWLNGEGGSRAGYVHPAVTCNSCELAS